MTTNSQQPCWKIHRPRRRIASGRARLRHADIRFAPDWTQPLHGLPDQPASGGPRPGVVLIHENRGLNPPIRDVRADCMAGFTVLAPDYLSAGAAPNDEDRARQAFAEMDPVLARRISLAALAALRERGATKGSGRTGLCWGGGQVGQLAVRGRLCRPRWCTTARHRPAMRWPPFGRHCCCTTPGWTPVSTPCCRPSRRPYAQQGSAISCIATQTWIMPSTMANPARFMPKLPHWPGRGGLSACLQLGWARMPSCAGRAGFFKQGRVCGIAVFAHW